MTTEPTTPEKPDLSSIVLKHGSHTRRESGMCIMEAVAYFAGLPHSDEPECTDRVLTRVCIRLNDRWDEAARQKLLPLIPILVGTRGSLELSRRRAFFIVDRVIRSTLPSFLRELPGKPRADLADQFEGLPPIVDRQSERRGRYRSGRAPAPWRRGERADPAGRQPLRNDRSRRSEARRGGRT